MINIENLSVDFGGEKALDRVNLHIAPGEFVFLTGPSGCGKSTLARCLNGVIPNSVPAEITGRLLVDGCDTATTPVAELATHVGLVFQNPATQLFNLTVDDEVAFGPRNLGLNDDEIARRSEWACAATGIAHLRGRRIQTLSGGEQQRLAIASVLAMGSRILVLDEPTSSLDVASTREVLATLGHLYAEGITIVVIEHRLEAARLASRTILMDQGHVIADGPTASVFDQRELVRRLGLRRPTDESQDDWVSLVKPNGALTGEPMVTLRGIEAGYGSHMVLRGLDLSLHQGEFVALVGMNAAGKSTLARVLAGLLKPKRGEIRLGNGQRLRPGRHIALLFQNPMHQLFCDTVDEEIRFGPENLGSYDPQHLDQVLDATDLQALRHMPIHALSSGQQQRTALAAILAAQPQIVILDEPTIGQDWRHLSQFMDFLTRLNQQGITILLITHDFKLVHRYAHRLLLLQEGRIVADGTPVRR